MYNYSSPNFGVYTTNNDTQVQYRNEQQYMKLKNLYEYTLDEAFWSRFWS